MKKKSNIKKLIKAAGYVFLGVFMIIIINFLCAWRIGINGPLSLFLFILSLLSSVAGVWFVKEGIEYINKK